MTLYDVIIIGGGPAGLNAAIVLGRCRRNVLLFDDGHQRNIKSHGIHNYLTRDGAQPAEFISLAKKEARKYQVQMKQVTVTEASRDGNHFKVRDEKGTTYSAKKILVATGLNDRLPELEGIEELYGSSVFHCPYCDGWEVRDRKIGVYARNKNGFELAVSLKTWSVDVCLLTDGRHYLTATELKTLEQFGIPVISSRIKKLIPHKGKLKSIQLRNGDSLPCDALFFVNGYNQQSKIVEALGCTMNKRKIAVTNRLQGTNIPGLYVAGDASRDMHFVVVAAAEGAKAGVTINKEIQKEEQEKQLAGAKKNLRNRMVPHIFVT